jgi:uncharacterized protein YlxW (UPF0749 family)
MNGSELNNSELVQMADILPPAVPVSAISVAGIYLFLLLLVAVIVVFGFRYQKSSKRKLRRLRKRYLRHKLDNRQCAFQLKRQLRDDVNTSTVSARQGRDWLEYSTALQAACYSSRSLDDGAMLQLLSDAERWL